MQGEAPHAFSRDPQGANPCTSRQHSASVKRKLVAQILKTKCNGMGEEALKEQNTGLEN